MYSFKGIGTTPYRSTKEEELVGNERMEEEHIRYPRCSHQVVRRFIMQGPRDDAQDVHARRTVCGGRLDERVKKTRLLSPP
jgi:hypothetical protein